MTDTTTPTTVCEYYALCENQTDSATDHPVLGEVPTCQRCADKHDLELHKIPVWDEDPPSEADIWWETNVFYEQDEFGQAIYGSDGP